MKDLDASRLTNENLEKKCARYEDLLQKESVANLSTNQEYEKKQGILEMQIAELQTKSQQHETTNHESTKNMSLLKVQNTGLEEKILHLDSLRASETQAAEARIEQLRAQFQKNLDLEAKRTDQIKKTLLADILILQKEKATLQESLNESRKELITTKVKYEEKLTTFESEIRQKQNESVSCSLSSLEEAVMRISRERDSFVRETQQKEAQMQSMLATALKDRAEFEGWISAEKERTRHAEGKVRELQLEIAQLSGSLQTRDQQIKSQTLSLQQASHLQDQVRDDHRRTLERILLESGNQCELLESQCREKDGHNSELTNRNHNLSIEIQVLRKETKRRRLVLSAALHEIQNALPEEDLPVKRRSESRVKQRRISRSSIRREIQRAMAESPCASRPQTPNIIPPAQKQSRPVIQEKTSFVHHQMEPRISREARAPMLRQISRGSTNRSPIPSPPPSPTNQLTLQDADSLTSSESDICYEAEDFDSPESHKQGFASVRSRSSSVGDTISLDVVGL